MTFISPKNDKRSRSAMVVFDNCGRAIAANEKKKKKQFIGCVSQFRYSVMDL
jgi:hypothetical protein